MLPIADNEQAAAAKYAIDRAMLEAGEWQLLAGETLLAIIGEANCELSVEWSKLIFAWWDTERSQSWRVAAYEIDEAEVRLQATRGLGLEMATLTLRNEAKWRARAADENLPLAKRRKIYAQTLTRLLAERFGNLRLQSLTAGQHARLRLESGGNTALAVGASSAESQADIDAIVAAGLVWLANFNRQRESKQSEKRASRLWFCLPRGCSQTAIERLTLLDASHFGARIECFEVDEQRDELRQVQLAAQTELLNTHPRELKWPEAAPADNRWRERILRLAPGLIEVRQMPARANSARCESYSINGLEFARSSQAEGEETRVKFGVAGLRDENRAESFYAPNETLSEAGFHQLENLVREIADNRVAQSPDRRHPFYRLREEAWLESLLRRDICALNPGFDDRFVYSQIPAWRGDERSVIDLLTVTHDARLAVIEIKATEDAELPLQGLDYWLRVEQARLRGEFARRGLFGGIKLADQSALLYLVAPRLRFHRTFAIVARCLSPQIEAYQVGINANWREGVRARSIEHINPTDR